MLAYQVCECATSEPVDAGRHRDIGREDVQGRVGLGEAAVLLGERQRVGALGAHAEHLEVDQLAQMAGQEVDMDSGTAVDLGRVLTGQQAHAHDANLASASHVGVASQPRRLGSCAIGARV